ncbi:hypothetical protein [Rhizobium sp. L43]|uniref:hypothetical protein n=1 Tax=Rhizobium sp. L43 TaxID=2035452 RepID=UPI000BE86FC0|nr:hypothetical protein [Rhizobium sp. L43]PDS75462.1 hypothetical protein CO667_26635 [Rhizobium sp. L43]
MAKKGEKLTPEHRAALDAGRSKALKGRKQSPEHVAARFEGMARVRAATVRVSRNDAAMLEVLRKFWTTYCYVRSEASSRGNSVSFSISEQGTVSNFAAVLTRNNILSNELASFTNLTDAWLDGQDVLLAKLAQE